MRRHTIALSIYSSKPNVCFSMPNLLSSIHQQLSPTFLRQKLGSLKNSFYGIGNAITNLILTRYRESKDGYCTHLILNKTRDQD